MEKIDLLFLIVIVLSIFQLLSCFAIMKYAQAVNEQVKLNSEYVGRFLKFIDKLVERNPDLTTQT